MHAPWRKALGNRPVLREVQGVELWMPWSHRLPDYARVSPDYGQNLVALVSGIAAGAPGSGPVQVVDVGANIGDSTKQILHAVAARVLAIEADEYYLDYLRRNVGDLDGVSIAPVLLTTADDAGRDWSPVRSGGTTHFTEAAAVTRVTSLPVTDLPDAYPGFDDVRLIKSDTDGHDTGLVPELAEVFAASRPVLFFEYDVALTGRVAGVDAADVWARLAELGYDKVGVWGNRGAPLALTTCGSAAEVTGRILAATAPDVVYLDVAVVHASDEVGQDALAALFRDIPRSRVTPSTPKAVMSPVQLSFLVPSYNAGKYLVTAIESVADQLQPGDEVLVQDGGSTDGSVEELLARFGDQEWLSVVSAPDEGQSDALQKALDRATNDYVMWLNADDIVYPGSLAVVRAGLVDGPDLLVGRSTIFNNDGRVVRTYTPRTITREAFVGHGAQLFTGSMVFRRELVRQAGGFDARFQYCMDMDMIVRFVEQDPTIAYVPEVIGGLRWHSESKGGSTLWPIVREATEVRLAHARGARERVTAITASSVYLVAGLLQPIRHSKPYSAVRARLRRPALPNAVDVL